MKKITFILLLIASVTLLTFALALAGPGGKIATKFATVFFKTFWGRVALVLLVLFFLPIIFYDSLSKRLSGWRTRKDLRFMASYDSRFEWLNIKERVSDCFTRTHSAWQEENLEALKGWMVDWYIQNQQLVYLDKWKNSGLKNICKIKKVTEVSPILFIHHNDGEEHNGSKIVIAITAYMQDYLARFENNEEVEIVEGVKDYFHIETIWSFTMIDGLWMVSNIEEASLCDNYTTLFNKLPKIQDTIVTKEKSA